MGGGGGSTWGKRRRSVPGSCPRILIATFPFLSGPGEEESGNSANCPHPPLPFAFSAAFHLPFATPPALPCQISSAFLFPAARGGLLSATPMRVAQHLPHANFVCFCDSLLCKFERWEGSETHSRLVSSPTLDVPGIRSHLQLLQERKKGSGNKSRDTPPLPARDAMGHRGSRPTPFLALCVCPGGRGWLAPRWGRSGGASGLLCFPPLSPPTLANSVLGCEVLGEKYAESGMCNGKGSGGWWGGTSSLPVHQRRRLSD